MAWLLPFHPAGDLDEAVEPKAGPNRRGSCKGIPQDRDERNARGAGGIVVVGHGPGEGSIGPQRSRGSAEVG